MCLSMFAKLTHLTLSLSLPSSMYHTHNCHTSLHNFSLSLSLSPLHYRQLCTELDQLSEKSPHSKYIYTNKILRFNICKFFDNWKKFNHECYLLYSVHEDISEAIYGLLQQGISHSFAQEPVQEERQRSALPLNNNIIDINFVFDSRSEPKLEF